MKILFTFFLLIVILISSSLSQPARLISSGGPARSSGVDTSCGIIWYPPVKISEVQSVFPRITLSGDDTVHVTFKGNFNFRLPYFRSVNGGASWEPVREVLTDSSTFWREPNGAEFIGSDRYLYIFFAGAQSAGGISPMHMTRSSDRGSTWEYPRIICPDTCTNVYAFAYYKDTIVILIDSMSVTGGNPGASFLRTTNAGLTWSKRKFEDYTNFTKIALTHNTLHLTDVFALNYRAAIMHKKSYDLGNTWSDSTVISSANGNSSDDPNIYATVSEMDDSKTATVFIAWRDNKYGCGALGACSIIGRQSNDDGNTYNNETLLTEYPNGYSPKMSISKNNLAVCWTKLEGLAKARVHVRISRDLGKTWCDVYNASPNAYSAIGPRIAVSNSAVHVIWYQRDSVFGDFYIHYRRGVFMPASVNEDIITAPNVFTLYQNYPNPFNQSTIINYQLSKDGIVSLKIYDIFGREIKTLVNERKEAGKYEVVWTAESATGGLASGVYFYRLQAGKYNSVKKMLLVK